MKIGIDIDDTITDTYEVSFAYAQNYTINELGRTGKINNVGVKHHFYLKVMHDWSDVEERAFWHKYYGEILTKVNPLTFALETIRKLKSEGNEIILITARWQEEDCDIKAITLDWLRKNNVPYDDFISNVTDKAKIAVEKSLNLFIDDSFENCKQVANEGIPTFIMNSRMNHDLDDPKITRVYSWPDVYDKIKKEEF